MSFSDLKGRVLSGGGIFEILRFVFIGSLATLTDLTVSVTLLYVFPSLHENAITTLAFAVAFFVSFFGHSRVTFRAEGSMLRFFALALAMMLLRNALVYVMVSAGLRGLPPLVLSMILVTGVTFALSKTLVFRQRGGD